MLNEEQIKEIKELLDKKYDNQMSEYFIKCLDEDLDKYISKSGNPNEFELLVYACRIRKIVNDFISDLNEYQRLRYYNIGHRNYPVNRVIQNVDDDYNFRVSKSKNMSLEKNIEQIEDEIKSDATLTHYKKGKKVLRKNYR